MLKKIKNFILLAILIIRLLTSLLIFGTQFLLLKLNKKRALTPLLLLVFLILCLINWQLWQKKKNPIIQLKPALSQNSGEILFALDQQETQSLKNFYYNLENRQKNNRDVLFNLGKLLELDDQNLAGEKFRQSWELDPNYLR